MVTVSQSGSEVVFNCDFKGEIPDGAITEVEWFIVGTYHAPYSPNRALEIE